MVPKAKDGHLDPNPLDVKTKLAKNARRFRKAAKLTQQDVAEQAQLELSTILRLEHAKFDSTLSTVARVRKALGVSWEKLLRGI